MEIRAKVDTFRVVGDALEAAIERGMRRHDKYSPITLEESQRDLLRREIEASFWLALEDAGVRLV